MLSTNSLTVIKSISNKVWLVEDKSTGHMFIKKEIDINNKVYKLLQGVISEYLPKVYEVITEDDKVFVIEDYISGTVLVEYDYLSLPYLNKIDILIQLCNAIRVLHSYFIIHRDIKPDNVIITDNCTIKLIDFDAARIKNSYVKKDTRQLGTPGYAPPEQYGFCQTDERSDIYSFGVLFNTVFNGKPPFVLKHIIKKCTQFDPNKRYSSIVKVRRVLTLAKYLF